MTSSVTLPWIDDVKNQLDLGNKLSLARASDGIQITKKGWIVNKSAAITCEKFLEEVIDTPYSRIFGPHETVKCTDDSCRSYIHIRYVSVKEARGSLGEALLEEEERIRTHPSTKDFVLAPFRIFDCPLKKKSDFLRIEEYFGLKGNTSVYWKSGTSEEMRAKIKEGVRTIVSHFHSLGYVTGATSLRAFVYDEFDDFYLADLSGVKKATPEDKKKEVRTLGSFFRDIGLRRHREENDFDFEKTGVVLPSVDKWPLQGTPQFVQKMSKLMISFGILDAERETGKCDRKKGEPIKLLPYQMAAAGACSPSTSCRRALLVMSTGAGKTFTVIHAINGFLQSSRYAEGVSVPSRILVLFREQNLVNQFKDDMDTLPVLGKVRELNTSYVPGKKVPTSAENVEVILAKYSSLANTIVKNGRGILKGAVVFADEVHSMRDATVNTNPQSMKNMKNVFGKDFTAPGDIHSFYGLTATPFVDIHQFIGLMNLIAKGSNLDSLVIDDVEKFVNTHLSEKAFNAWNSFLQLKCGSRNKNDGTSYYGLDGPEKVGSFVSALYSRLSQYVFYVDATKMKSFFPDKTWEIVAFEPPQEFIEESFLNKAARNRKRNKSYGEKDLKVLKNSQVDASHNREKMKKLKTKKNPTREDIKRVVPVVEELVKNLQNRKGKAIVLSTYDPGSSVVPAYDAILLLKKMGVKGLVDCNIDIITERRVKDTVLEQFISSKKTGTESSILFLGKKMATGIDIKGGVRQMHMLNSIHSETLYKQATGRPVRNCSHVGLEGKDWNVDFFQYLMIGKLVMDEEKGLTALTCDVVNFAMRAETRTVEVACMAAVEMASFSCAAYSGLHGGSCGVQNVTKKIKEEERNVSSLTSFVKSVLGAARGIAKSTIHLLGNLVTESTRYAKNRYLV